MRASRVWSRAHAICDARTQIVAACSASSTTASSPDEKAAWRRLHSSSDTVAEAAPPPMKPMSRRWVSARCMLLRFHEFDETAERRLRMDECDLESEQARSRCLVDEPHALGAEAVEVRLDAAHL